MFPIAARAAAPPLTPVKARCEHRTAYHGENSVMTIGVISALPEEIRRLGDHLEVEDKVARGGYAFRVGRIDGIPVTLVEAGIGKVNTALVATLLFDHFHCRSVLFTGVAGGIDPD